MPIRLCSILATSAILALAGVGIALAAKPKAGDTYSTASGASPSVSFKAASAKKLTEFSATEAWKCTGTCGGIITSITANACSQAVKDQLGYQAKTLAAQAEDEKTAGHALEVVGGLTITGGLALTTDSVVAYLGLGASGPVGWTVAGVGAVVTLTGLGASTKGGIDAAASRRLEAQKEHDPPSSNYKTVAEPAVTAPSPVQIPAGTEPAVASAFADANKVLENEAQLSAVSAVVTTSLDRTSGAIAAKDKAAYELQKAALVKYLGEEATLLREGVTLRETFEAAFKATQYQLTIPHAGLMKLANQIKSEGLDSTAVAYLTQKGDTPAEIQAQGAKIARELAWLKGGVNLTEDFIDNQGNAGDSRLANTLQKAATKIAKVP